MTERRCYCLWWQEQLKVKAGTIEGTSEAGTIEAPFFIINDTLWLDQVFTPEDWLRSRATGTLKHLSVLSVLYILLNGISR